MTKIDKKTVRSVADNFFNKQIIENITGTENINTINTVESLYPNHKTESIEETPKADSIAGNNKIEDTEIKVEPRRRGRRPKAVKYNAKILLTVTPEMRDKIFAFSDEVGMSVVEMLREAITDWMDAKSQNKE